MATPPRTPNRRDVANNARPWAVDSWFPVNLGGLSPLSTPRRPRKKSSYQEERLRETPILSLVLVQLDGLMSDYCKFLSQVDAEACVKLLHSEVAKVPPTREQRVATPSLRRSPLHSWLSRSPDETTTAQMTRASVLESHLDIFLLLAGIEAMYSSLAHAHSMATANHLVSCCYHVVDAFTQMKERLCDPLIQASDFVSPYVEKARILGNALTVLVQFAKARGQLIMAHTILWEQRKPNFVELGNTFAGLLQDIPEQCGTASTLAQSLTEELQVWSGISRLALAIQRCRFAESITTAHAIKTKLMNRPKCFHDEWVASVLHSLVQLFPIIFDKPVAFSERLYGFGDDTESKEEESHREAPPVSVETMVQDFFRQYGSTSTTAIAVIVDAVRTNNTSVEKGFVVFERGLPEFALRTGGDTARHLFPAVYLRTSHGRSGLLLNREAGTTSPGRRRSRPDWSPRQKLVGSASPRHQTKGEHGDKERFSAKESIAMEYCPEEGSDSIWPHSDWPFLVAMLAGISELSAQGGLDQPTRNRSDLRSPSPSQLYAGLMTPTTHVFSGEESLLCIAGVSDYLWVVGMSKNSSRRQERTALVEENLRHFVSTLASHMRVSSSFARTQVLKQREQHQRAPSHAVGFDLSRNFENREWSDKDKKAMFSMIRNAMKQLYVPKGSQDQKRNMFWDRSAISGRQMAFEKSAAAFFLGKDLMHSISFAQK